MKQAWLSSHDASGREWMLAACVERVQNDVGFLYLAATRESMFQIRERLIASCGGLVHGRVLGFDDLERMLVNTRQTSRQATPNERLTLLRSLLESWGYAHVYAKSALKPGFIRSVASVIVQLKRLRVGPEELRALAADDSSSGLAANGSSRLADNGSSLENDSVPLTDRKPTPQRSELNPPRSGLSPLSRGTPALSDKLNFLAALCDQYQQAMSDHGWSDAGDRSRMSCEAVPQAECLQGVGLIVLDGFQQLDPVRLELIRRIAEHHPQIDMLANVPWMSPDQSDFIQETLVADLSSIGFSICVHSAPPLTPAQPFLHPERLHLRASPSEDHEIREAARDIKRRLLENGRAPETCAIFCPDPEAWRPAIDAVFQEYGLPLRGRAETPIARVPVVQDLMALWSVHPTDDFASALQTLVSSKYLLPLPWLQQAGYETDALMRIAMDCAAARSPEEWIQAFRSRAIGAAQPLVASEAHSSLLDAHLDRILSLPLLEPPASAADAVSAFLDLLAAFAPEERVHTLADAGVLPEENRLRDLQALSRLRALLQEFVDLNSRFRAKAASPYSREELLRELQDLLESTPLPVANRDVSGVRLLSPDMADGQRYEAVWFLGFNEGVFPFASGGHPLFDEQEAEALSIHGIPLFDRKRLLEQDKLRFNAVRFAAVEQLTFSWHTADENGTLCVPSPFLDDVVAALDKDSRERLKPRALSMRERMDFRMQPAGKAELERFWMRRLVESETIAADRTHAAIHAGVPHPDIHPCDALPVEAPDPHHTDTLAALHLGLNRANIEHLREASPVFGSYDGVLSSPTLAQQDASFGFSASQLNSLARCPFTYFAERVLSLGDMDDDPLGPLNTGNYYHKVLQAWHAENPDPEVYSDERLDALMHRFEADFDRSALPPQVSDALLVERRAVLSSFLLVDAENYARWRQATGNRLVPVLLEHPFELFLPGDVRVRGYIDRVDLEQDAAGRWTGRHVIVDYKKNGIKDMKDIIERHEYQLPLYRVAAAQALRERFGIDSPELVALLWFSVEKAEWKGVAREDAKAALFGPKKRPKLLSARMMDVLLSWSEDDARSRVEQIRAGHFRPPASCPAGEIFPCRFRGLCRFDRGSMERRLALQEERA